MNNIDPWLILLHTPDLGVKTAHILLQRFGDPACILNASSTQLGQAGLKPAVIASLLEPDLTKLNKDLDWAQDDDHHIIAFNDQRYPPQLKNIADAPLVLFVRGDPDYLHRPQLAMVGSRNPTALGKKTASEFAEHLSNSGITITSGLAKGIDGASHAGALKGIAGTVALVAHGLDIVYPAEHRKLAEEISRNGAVVSEMVTGTVPQKGLFPRRNRIISGLALGTLVVEAALKSGSLITARQAIEQGREVFAIPGSIHNPLSRGCHLLIRQGAKLVETAADILEELFPYLDRESNPGREISNIATTDQKLDPDHQKLLKCLQYEPRTIDELVNLSGFTAAEVASMLLIMELKGQIVSEGSLYTQCK